jgi:tRNA(fMet)-specific endonuclease VapC
MLRISSAIASRGTRLRGADLDSSVVIAGERRGRTVRQILEQFKRNYGVIEIGLSVVTIVELIHGVQRAGTEERRLRRQAFVDELIRDVPVYPVTSRRRV